VKYLDEFRDGDIAKRIAEEIHRITTRPWATMEVCDGQTHSIIRNGIDQILPAGIELIHGPGCPVCVTPLDVIDQALAIASRPEVTFCSFGDMLRVPGSGKDLFQVKSEGGDVRVVYSPLDAVRLAESFPDREVVFFGIGFETTAPANAMAVHVAKQQGLRNFSMLVSHVLVPPAIAAIMTSPRSRVQAFLAAGHVCAVMGLHQYPTSRAFARRSRHCAGVARCCRARSSRTHAPRSAGNARPARRSARRWSRARARVPRTTTTGASGMTTRR
jgi:hydrogenase expression/formation protein HypD